MLFEVGRRTRWRAGRSGRYHQSNGVPADRVIRSEARACEFLQTILPREPRANHDCRQGQPRSRVRGSLVKVLIAEDDPIASRLMRAVLADCELEVIVAADGDEAVEMIERENPALILLDWNLPGRTGLEICQHVRQRNQRERPYIVMVTCRDADDDVVTAFAAGADDYVRKPIHPRQLLARLQAGMRLVLREHALVQEHAALQTALASLRDMPALVPICSCCRRVSDGEDAWLAADRYLALRAGVQFTHGLCPTCAPRFLEPKRRTGSGLPEFGADGRDPS